MVCLGRPGLLRRKIADGLLHLAGVAQFDHFAHHTILAIPDDNFFPNDAVLVRDQPARTQDELARPSRLLQALAPIPDVREPYRTRVDVDVKRVGTDFAVLVAGFVEDLEAVGGVDGKLEKGSEVHHVPRFVWIRPFFRPPKTCRRRGRRRERAINVGQMIVDVHRGVEAEFFDICHRHVVYALHGI